MGADNVGQERGREEGGNGMQSDVNDSLSKDLFKLLESSPWPNCTLYLIWHYLSHGHPDSALLEFRHDSDKLINRKAVEAILYHVEMG